MKGLSEEGREKLRAQIEMFKALHQAHLYYKENERLQAALKAIESQCYNEGSYHEIAEIVSKALRGETVDT